MRRPMLVVVAMVFAVAAGIALGAGPLSTAQPAEVVAPGRETPAPKPTEADPRAAYADAFAASVVSRLYDGDELPGRGVAVVTMPGVPGEPLEALLTEVANTGASVVSRYAVEPSLLDAAQKPLVDTLGSQLAEQLTATTVPAEATTYERLGALLGGVVGSKMRKGAEPTADAGTVELSLARAGLVRAGAAASQRAPIVLVVLGEEPGESADPALRGLVAGLAGTARSLVLVGAAEAAADGGVLARYRAEEPVPGVTTVDGIDGPVGRVTAVLAMARSFTVAGGDFGASGADGPVPMG